jgi:mono/diheme cytochrome c family protein
MRIALLPLGATALALAGLTPLVAGEMAMPGVSQPKRAKVDYILKCQGCHQPDGSGNAVNTPPLQGEVAKFLAVPGGREFLGRVPGVASTDLDDARLAEVLNYTLYRFDPGHIPAGFKPYTAAELAALRKSPLRLDRLAVRAELAARLKSQPTP